MWMRFCTVSQNSKYEIYGVGEEKNARRSDSDSLVETCELASLPGIGKHSSFPFYKTYKHDMYARDDQQ